MRKVHLSSLILALFLVYFPLAFIFRSIFWKGDDVYEYMRSSLFGSAGTNTLILLLGVCISTLILGVGLAALVKFFEFPFSKFFSWAFMLPLAFPTYVMAFIYIGLLDFTGPIQTWAREVYGTEASQYFPQFRSAGGVIFVFSLCLYPYVYLLTCNAFETLSYKTIEVSKTLGVSSRRSFFKLLLPLSLPWIFSGLILVAMETLADFGGVAAFNYETITILIYKSWYGLQSIEAALKIASWLGIPALALLGLNQYLKGRRKYFSNAPTTEPKLHRLSGFYKWTAFSICFFVLIFVFLLPLGKLLYWSAFSYRLEFQTFRFSDLWHSVAQSFISATLITGLAFLFTCMLRYGRKYDRLVVSLSLVGYALPGTILAVAMFQYFAFIDNNIWFPILESFDDTWGVPLASSLVALLAGLMCRYLSVAFNGLDSQMGRIHPHIGFASHTLGADSIKTVWKLYLPLLNKGLWVSFVLVFVDVMKEMPITLMTRPVGWDTLSIRVHEFTSEGDWENAALPSLILVCVGMIPLALMKLTQEKNS